MPDPEAPDEIIQLASQRSAARSARDWQTADDLRAAIEAAGWQVVDAGSDFALRPARPADIVEADRTLYGSPTSVPSRLDEPDVPGASIVIALSATEDTAPGGLSRILELSPPDSRLLVVADRDVPLEDVGNGDRIETVWTAAPFSPGDALQAALRRATSAVLVVLDPQRSPSGDVVSPLLNALEDPTVAIAGHEGLHSQDLRRFHPAESGDVVALRSGCYAFRRADAVARGPIEGRLHLPGSVAAWWSLVLRDQGDGVQPRRALALELPLKAAEPVPLPHDHARQARRDNYRISDRFGKRRELATAPAMASPR